jgi:filamentous hemagglutinin family protein
MHYRKIEVWLTEIRRSLSASSVPIYLRQIAPKFFQGEGGLKNCSARIYWRSLSVSSAPIYLRQIALNFFQGEGGLKNCSARIYLRSLTKQSDFCKCSESATISRKTQDWRCWCSRFVLATVLITSLQERVFAQITPDGTLPNNSVVTPDGNTLNISGGTQAGSNLFHSFGEFSVPNGGTAFFNNAVDIQNIISRVTGKSISNIDGLIRANGTANLFMINPNGIIFGKDARLDVGGSFLASTASSINFVDGIKFSTNAPQTKPLLSVNVPFGLQYEKNSERILNQSQGKIISGAVGLQVKPGKTLALVGGDVELEGGKLSAPGGRVELGGLTEPGTLKLNFDSNNLNLSFPDQVARANVSLTNQTGIDVTAGGGGDIIVNAHNLSILGESILSSGIGQGLGSINAQAGNITLNATESIVMNEASAITNSALSQATGNAGNINVNTGSLFATDGGFLSASTYGQGNAGSININARDTVSFSGESSNGYPSGVESSVELGATGKGGNININTGSLSLTKGAGLVVLTRTQGDAGSININARDTVSFNGKRRNGFRSVASGSVEKGATGKGGSININTGSLLVTDAGALNASTYGQGDAGSVNVNARDTILFDTEGAIYGFVQNEAIGDGGNININTGSLLAKSGAALTTSTRGQGNAGSISIKARDTVSLDGVGRNGFSSGVSSSVGGQGIGNGGSINIETGTLFVTNGAILFVSIEGKGNAGSININARDNISFDGVGRNKSPSAVSIAVRPKGIGNSGNIDIETGTLFVTNGAQLLATTQGKGNAGSINIKARDTVSFDGVGNGGFPSSARASVRSQALGNGGSIDIETGTLFVKNGADLLARSQGSNNVAGNIVVRAGSIRLDEQAVLSSETQGGQGNIFLNSQDLILGRSSKITTSATGENVVGGNINIDTDFLIATQNSDISANSQDFRGGNVRIKTQSIFGIQVRDVASDSTSDITATGSSRELSGTIELNTPGIDLNSGLVELPSIPVDTEVAQGCYSPNVAQSRFVITGRGGLPPNPKDVLTADPAQIDWVSVKPRKNDRSLPPVTTKPTTSTPKRIVEATGTTLNAKGQIVLTANSSTVTPHTSTQKTIQCHGS